MFAEDFVIGEVYYTNVYKESRTVFKKNSKKKMISRK